MSRLAFIDIETTGFSRQWDYIIEIAALLYDTEEKKVIKEFHEYIKPGKNIPAKITEITGITNAMVADARDEVEVLTDFVEWMTLNKIDATVGHNIERFDRDFIKVRCGRYSIPMFESEYIDTLKIAREKKIPVTMKTATGRPSYKQEALANFYGITYQAHSAIEDVKALIKIYEEMTSKKTIEKRRKSLGF